MKNEDNIYDVIILGAGAAGLMSAITAGKRGKKVLILEKSNKVGKDSHKLKHLLQLWHTSNCLRISASKESSFKYSGRTVNELIAAGLPVTAELALYAMLVALIIGISAGVFAAIRPNTMQDYLPMSAAMLGICMPSFLLGPILILVFGIHLEWLPISGWGDIPGDKILPAITLGTGYAAYIARLSRGGLLEVLSQDYIRAARAKGLSERLIICKHALRGGLIPVIAFLGPAFAVLLGGSFVVEAIFQIPCLGRFYVTSAFNRDYTMILGMTIFFAGRIIVFNLISDMLALWLNPKLRQQARGGQ